MNKVVKLWFDKRKTSEWISEVTSCLFEKGRVNEIVQLWVDKAIDRQVNKVVKLWIVKVKKEEKIK